MNATDELALYFCNMIILVVAAAKNNAIGKDNQLLWHLPNDLRFFKNTTWGSVVIMGRKTFESVNKPLPGRLNIVVTTNASWSAENVLVAASLGDAITQAQQAGYKTIFIIGGGEIYRQSMSIADQIILTRVDTSPEADTFFPEMAPEDWRLEKKDDHSKDEKHAFDYSFQVWARKR